MSPLGPIDPNSVPEAETEKTAPWIVRKLVGVCGLSCLPGGDLTGHMVFCVLVRCAPTPRTRAVCAGCRWMLSVHDRSDRQGVVADPQGIGNQCHMPFARASVRLLTTGPH